MAKKEDDNPFEAIIGFVVLFGLGYLIFSQVLPAVGSFAGGLFNSSSDKEYCGRSHQVLSAKTNAAAKLAYKSCLRRMKD